MESNSDDLKKFMIIALVGAVLISFASIIYLLSDANPLTGAFFRMFYALPLLGLVIWYLNKKDPRVLSTRMLAGVAGIVFSFDFVMYHSAVIWIGAGIGTLIANSQVIIVTLMSWWILGEKPNSFILISLPIVVFGFLLVSGIWDEDPYGSHPVRGVVAGIFASFFYSGFLMIYRYANKDLAPATNLQFDSTAGCCFGILMISILPLQSIYIEPLDFQPTWPMHGWLFLLAVVSQVMGWLMISYSLPRLPAVHTSFAILLQPVLTIVWGILLLSESPSIQQAIGMALILGSIIGVTLYGSVEDGAEGEI